MVVGLRPRSEADRPEGVTVRPIKPEKRDRILKLHASNPDLPHSTIGLRCGVSSDTVRRVIEQVEQAESKKPAIPKGE